jgi:hypothetical protein
MLGSIKIVVMIFRANKTPYHVVHKQYKVLKMLPRLSVEVELDVGAGDLSNLLCLLEYIGYAFSSWTAVRELQVFVKLKLRYLRNVSSYL